MTTATDGPLEVVPSEDTIAYFSMEVALEPDIPTYSGGLGMLAGDALRSASDLHVPMMGISLVCRRGYFRQRLAADGTQTEEDLTWNLAAYLQELPVRVRFNCRVAPCAFAPGAISSRVRTDIQCRSCCSTLILRTTPTATGA